ncbi:putative disease resistance RPP13-like protein 1 isoform X1 [Trifolium pratense]|uniref:putative disease resistance RPP13-like protein 1 isoform X1 n=1 Tax=Trifolium pratense TaxID=57577 RepID=UPI001E696B9F|nr:putative disease resistance RPP13-like protein 1 isoform X1 [Trifolium pratense]XP_045819819.1 putative disease resistance RPP13-like protein 1 isoform X1 [Trifolium pratense]
MAKLVAEAFLSSFGQYIFERLASSNLADYFRRGKLDKLVEELESTLDSITQVLDDAEIKQYQIPDVKKWLGNVKHAMYEADQLLDEIATDAPLKKLKAESQPSTSHNIVNFIPTLTNPFESRIKELIKSLHSLVEQMDTLQLKNQTYASNAVGFNSKPPGIEETTCLVDASDIYGRDVDKEEMIKILLSSENDSSNKTPIISIVGLGGMGKTTFAKLVYNDNKIMEHFELKAWVYVSESFDVVGLTKEILKTFKSPAEGESNLNLLQLRLQQTLTGKKYLLVLDDIWNGNEKSWMQLLLPFDHGSSGSKIIVTTRDKEITYVLKSTKLFNLQQLNKSDCWSLFVTHAFGGKNLDEYPHLEQIGMKIVDKCGGLPLAVKTLGQLLQRKSDHEWRKILETDLWRLSDKDNDINPTLRLSYHNLPSNRKRCFAYCSLFPKGYIDKHELIKFWMADGLLKCSGADKSEEELGNEIFTDLESISFFQKSFFGFVMHDLVNDLAKSVSGEFCMQIGGSRVEGIPERTRHILLSSQLNCGDKLLESICKCKGLRSLIVKSNTTTLISNDVQRDLFSRLTWLRMLSFRYCGLSELVDEIGNLKLLRYLDLSHTEIKSLPDTICMLYNLQTLLLERCDELTELPSKFSKLINLRHLELPFRYRHVPVLKKMPKNIGKLNKLQSLPYFIVEEQHGSNIKELEKLNHLHGSIHIKGLGNVIDPADAVMANLKDKKYLEELYMDFCKNGREEMNELIVERNVSVLEALHPNSNLKRLTIVNYSGNSFPNWLRGSDLPNLVSYIMLKEVYIRECPELKRIPPQHLPSLQKLEISDCNKLEECLCLEGSPLLKELYIRGCPELKRIPPQHLPSLQKFEISYCNKLEECLCLEGSPLLENVSIKRCSKLKRAPLPQHLPSLQKLVISDCNKLEELSCLEGFPLLKELYIRECPELKRIPPQHLPSLQKLEISDCNKFEECLCLEGSPLLKELYIRECSKLKRAPLPQHLPSLQKLVISDCNKLEELSCLEGFPLLKELYIRECPELKRIPPQHLPSLQKLDISDCNKLEECLCLEGSPLLKELYIRECSKLKRAPLPQHLPSLQKLVISDCNKLEECLCLEGSPLLENVSIKNCSKLKRVPLPQHLPSLQKLYICDCEMLEASIPKGDSMIELVLERCDRILVNELPTSLKKFVLLGNRYVEFSDEQNLVKCTVLEVLKFDLEGIVKRPSLDLRCYNSLRNLTIKECHSSSSLPFSLHLFTNLEYLKLYDCPQLESFPSGGLPSNLTRLEIENCPKLIGSREEWGLFQLNSLKVFSVSDAEFENVESFPEENLLPPTLVSLSLYKCSKLRIMNNKGFLHLNSLEYLWIDNCPSLESLPEEGLPSSQLWIKECPIIREKYKKEGGERWHTIRHIPHVEIDYIIEQHE